MHTEACSAVDEIHLLTERPDEPNLHYVEAALAGKLELPRLRAAVAAVLEAEPAARARIATTSPCACGPSGPCPTAPRRTL